MGVGLGVCVGSGVEVGVGVMVGVRDGVKVGVGVRPLGMRASMPTVPAGAKLGL